MCTYFVHLIYIYEGLNIVINCGLISAEVEVFHSSSTASHNYFTSSQVVLFQKLFVFMKTLFMTASGFKRLLLSFTMRYN